VHGRFGEQRVGLARRQVRARLDLAWKSGFGGWRKLCTFWRLETKCLSAGTELLEIFAAFVVSIDIFIFWGGCRRNIRWPRVRCSRIWIAFATR